MTNIEIKDNLVDIVKQILKTEFVDDNSLYLIVSESILAITLVTTIEEEFNIEFDDDDIDVNFFNSFDEIISRMRRYL